MSINDQKQMMNQSRPLKDKSFTIKRTSEVNKPLQPIHKVFSEDQHSIKIHIKDIILL